MDVLRIGEVLGDRPVAGSIRPRLSAREEPPPPATELADEGTWDLFLAGHLTRAGRYGLPDLLSAEGDEKYGEWRRVFLERDIGLADAEEASRRFVRLADHPKPWDHLAVLLRLCGEIRRERDRAQEAAAEQQARLMAAEGEQRAWVEWLRRAELDRADWLARAAQENPGLARWPQVVERVAALLAWEHGGPLREPGEVA